MTAESTARPLLTQCHLALMRLSLWWHGASRPQGLTAETDSGAGLQARNEGEDQPPNGDAIPAPLADGSTESDPDP